jgi:hypothetical protein
LADNFTNTSIQYGKQALLPQALAEVILLLENGSESPSQAISAKFAGRYTKSLLTTVFARNLL